MKEFIHVIVHHHGPIPEQRIINIAKAHQEDSFVILNRGACKGALDDAPS